MADHAHDVTLIEFVRMLLGLGPDKDENIELRDWFAKDPQAALEHYGLGDLTAEDVRDAVLIAQDNDTVSFDRNYDTGFDWDGGKGGWKWDGGKEGGHHHAAGEKVHVTDNFYEYDVDDRDTIVDNSVNQNIDTGGGDFRQSIETNSVTASGDGAVAAGRDIDGSTITTGNGNVVGDGNDVVKGDGNTIAFGSGDATSTGDVKADDGSAVSIGGNASGSHDATNSFNETTTTTTNETSIDGSYNQDFSQDNDSRFEDNSETHTHVGSHNSIDLGVEA
ncbi:MULTISPECIES: hypothetical protein [unclassified Pseudonocardia]|uniref:hypothetical protein n=1 Tax=unclassified Pseudonocardia TaxID=2619320 RepID=UPI0001FFE80C|nr:hypothetical protein [Pseudonocardia sp. Ae707_Ps1]OLM21402.1 hypothetical protein Ae707Ps1_5661 [Pseudonocardia sp. Ae707_Ps1]